MAPRVKTVASISNGKFLESHAEALGLSLQGEASVSTARSASRR